MSDPIPRISDESVNLKELIEDLQHIIEANETTHLMVREAFAQLSESMHAHIDDIDETVQRLKAKLSDLQTMQPYAR